MKRLTYKLAFNTVAQIIGKVFSTAVALATLSFMARYLEPDGLGDYATIIRFLGFFGIIADAGLNLIATREISQKRADIQRIMSNIFTMRIVSSFAIMTIGIIVSLFLPYSKSIKYGISIGSLAFLFILWSQIFNGMFQKKLQTEKIAVNEFIGKTIVLGLTIFAIKLKLSVIYFIYILVIGNLSIFVLYIISVKKFIKIRFKFNLDLWEKIFRLAWPLALLNFFTLIYANIDTLMLSVMKGSYDTGIYHMAYKVIEAIAQFSWVFVGLFVPLLAENPDASSPSFQKFFKKAFNAVLIFSFSSLILGMIFSSLIIKIIGGSGFVSSVLTLKILFTAVFFIFYNILFVQTFTVLNLQKKVLIIYFIGALFNFFANLVFIPKYSYTGAAWTTLASEALICMLSGIYLFIYFKNRKARIFPEM